MCVGILWMICFVGLLLCNVMNVVCCMMLLLVYFVNLYLVMSVGLI